MSITRRYYRTLPRWGKRLSRRFVAAYGKPAGLWLPNDVVNKAYDFSSNRNIGTLNGGITTTPGGFGVLGQSWQFNGTTQYIDFGIVPASLQKNRNFTLASLFSISSTAANSALICFGPSGPYLRVSNTGKLQFLQAQISILLTGATTVSLNAVHLAVVTVDASGNIALYLDSSPDATGSTAVTFSFTGHLTLGNQVGAGGNEFFPGVQYLDAIFATAISPAQVSSLYNCLRTGEPFPLFQPQIVRRGYGIRSIVGGSSFKFRRTLSDYGTRVGSRQAIG